MFASAIILYYFLTVEAIVNPFGPTVSSEYTNCIKSLISTNFEETGLVFVPSTSNASSSVIRIREDILKGLHEKLIYSVQTTITTREKKERNNSTSFPKYVVKIIPIANYYVIIVDGYSEFTNIVDKLVTLRTWNPRAWFIVLYLRLTDLHEITIKRYPERILTYLFKRNVISAVVIVPDYKNLRNGIVYGWRPFEPPTYCGYHNETADDRLLIEDMCLQGTLQNRNKLFEDRVPRDLTGCYLDIIAIKRQPFMSDNLRDLNIERKLLEGIAAIFKLKTRYELVHEFRGEKDEHEVWSGALTHVVTGKGDILVGGIFPDYDVHEDFDSSVPYLSDSYCWVVPRANQLPPWIALIIIFKKFVWYSAAAVFIICVFTWKILAVLSNDSQYHRSFDHCLLNAWYTTLGFSSYIRPVRESLRVFFIFFNIYCILFLTAYQTKLIDVLTHPSFEKQLETVEELVNSDLKFGGTEELHDIFENSTDPYDVMIEDEWINVDDIRKALIDVVVHRNFSVLCSRLELMYMSSVMPELSDRFGNPTYYRFKRPVFTVPLEIITLRGFPLLNRISEVLTAFAQMGVIQELLNIFRTNALRRTYLLHHNMDNKGTDENSLSLLHLEGGFLALAVGYVSGTAALIGEIIWNSQYVKNKYSSFLSYIKKTTRAR